MNWAEGTKKLEETIKIGKCKNRECLSGGKDNLEIVWFGNQYEQKKITCSSCFVMNDEAIKKSLPTNLNIVPVRFFFLLLSSFINKFIAEAKQYEELKASPKWGPMDLKQRQKEHLSELESFDLKLQGTLKSLSVALENFAKRVSEQNKLIYNNETFNEIISLYSNNQMDQSLSKIQSLINYLNIGEDSRERFDDIDLRAKRNEKLAGKIKYITEKTSQVLQELVQELKIKNEAISKI